MRKKLIILMLISSMILTVTACSKDKENPVVTPTAIPTEQVTNTPVDEEDEEEFYDVPTEAIEPVEDVEEPKTYSDTPLFKGEKISEDGTFTKEFDEYLNTYFDENGNPKDNVSTVYDKENKLIYFYNEKDELVYMDEYEPDENEGFIDEDDNTDIRRDYIVETIDSYCQPGMLENNLENNYLFWSKAQIKKTLIRDCSYQNWDDYDYEAVINEWLDKLYPLSDEEQAKRLIEFYTNLGYNDEMLKQEFEKNEIDLKYLTNTEIDYKESLTSLITMLQKREMYFSSKQDFYNLFIEDGWLNNLTKEEIKQIINDNFIERTDEELKGYYEAHPDFCGGKTIDEIIKEYHSEF